MTCICGVQTPRRHCYFCQRTVDLIRSGRCVSCTALVNQDDYEKQWGKCADCLSSNQRLSAATRRLLHQAANARYLVRSHSPLPLTARKIAA